MERHPSVNLPESLELWPEESGQIAGMPPDAFPTLTVYLPSEEHRTGQGVLILPGGGYGMVSTAKEGHRPAQFLNACGIAAAVLEYRHHPFVYPVPLLDAQQGMRVFRGWMREKGLDPDRAGVMGFSAGGHLAGLLSTQPELPHDSPGRYMNDEIVTPAFTLLIYPVVNLEKLFAHSGSKNNLLGPEADEHLIKTLSVDQAVGPETPPMFLVHAADDGTVPLENSLSLTRELNRHGVPVDLHVYAEGGHGFGMGAYHEWTRLMLDWLTRH